MNKKQIMIIINRDKDIIRKRAILFCVLAILYLMGRLQGASRPEIEAYADRVADFYEIPRPILHAVIEVESSFRVNPPCAGKGARGLMQVTPLAYTDYLRFNPNTYITNFQIVEDDWQANIAVGAWYLKYMCYLFNGKEWRKALTAYFWGPNHNSPTGTYYSKVLGQVYNNTEG